MSFFLEDVPPDGYKPLKHKACFTTVGWIKEYVEPHMRARAEDVLTLDFLQPNAGDKIQWQCPTCKKTVHGLHEVSLQ